MKKIILTGLVLSLFAATSLYSAVPKSITINNEVKDPETKKPVELAILWLDKNKQPLKGADAKVQVKGPTVTVNKNAQWFKVSTLNAPATYCSRYTSKKTGCALGSNSVQLNKSSYTIKQDPFQESLLKVS